MSGPALAAAAGLGFGVFQTLNRRAVGGMNDAYLATFLQLLVALGVLVVASAATEDLGLLAEATTASLVWLSEIPDAFEWLGIVVVLAGAFVVSLERVAETGWGVDWRDTAPGLATALAWSISPLFIKEGL